MNGISLTIVGLPASQGSKRHVGNGRMVEMSKTLPAWRRAIKIAAATAAQKHGQIDQPVVATATFVLPRPKRSKFPAPAGPPDTDKLQRALGDGLEAGGLLSNDSRIIRWDATKRWPLPNEATGCYVTLTPWEHT